MGQYMQNAWGNEECLLNVSQGNWDKETNWKTQV